MKHIAFILMITCCLSGCESAPTSKPSTKSIRSNQDETGLVVQHWRIREGGSSIDAALDQVSLDAEDPIHGERDFRHDGFRVLVVDETQLEEILSGLGSSFPMNRTWHGEAVAWRDLRSTRVDQGAVTLENGRARRLPASIVSLAGRSWSVPTVSSAGLHVQLIPHVVPQRPEKAVEFRPGELRGQALSSPLEVTLGPQEYLLLTSAAGLAKTPDSQEETSSQGPRPAATPGPGTLMPPTVAEMLLDEQNGGIRGILVIHGIPHPSLIPPG